MAYIISNGHESYIYSQPSGGMIIVDKVEFATKWQLRKKAENYLKNMKAGSKARKKMYGMYRVSEYIEPVTEFKPKFKYSSETDKNVLSEAKQIQTFLQNAKIELEKANKVRSTIDLSIVDLEHAIEFYTFTPEEGQKMLEKLHETLIKRRECKNEIKQLSLCIDAFKNVNMNSLIKQLKNVENQASTPRVLNDLFKQLESASQTLAKTSAKTSANSTSATVIQLPGANEKVS